MSGWAHWRRSFSSGCYGALRGKHGSNSVARFALAVLIYGVFQQTLSMVLLWPGFLVRVTPLQPMRYLHLVYFFFVLMAGCLLGKFVLKRSVWRWAAFLMVANCSMFGWQRVEFAGSQHLEIAVAAARKSLAASLRMGPREHARECLFRARSALS